MNHTDGSRPHPFLVEEEAWMLEARCAGVDVEIMFPGRGEDSSRAKRVCAECPVRAECLEFALTHFEKFGVWGGLSERERRRIRTARLRLVRAQGRA